MRTAKAAGAPCSTPARSRRRARGRLCRGARPQVVPIEICPVLAPPCKGRSTRPGQSRKNCNRQAARHPGDRTACRARCGRARLRPVDAGTIGSFGARRREPSACPHHPSRRIGCATRAADDLPSGHARVALPPGGFLQATAEGEAILAGLVWRACRARQNPLPICLPASVPSPCGLPSACGSTAVDSDAVAVAALRKAAAGAPGLKPVEAQVRDLFRRPLVAQELSRFDAVVFDPPRQGAQAQARELARSRVPRVVAVSCNPVTFARDASILIAGGYRIGAVRPGRSISLYRACRDRRRFER